MSCQASADAIRQYQSHASCACVSYGCSTSAGLGQYSRPEDIYNSVVNAAMSQRYEFTLSRLETELELLKRRKTDKTTCSHCGAPVNPYRADCEWCGCYY